MTRWDKYLIVIIIIVSLSSMFYIKNIATNSGEKYVSVEVDGKQHKKITFSNDNKKRYLDINTKYGYNKLEIYKEKVRVIEASCPDQLDIKQGFIENVGEIIVCLPNRMVVEVKGENVSDEEIDAGSY